MIVSLECCGVGKWLLWRAVKSVQKNTNRCDSALSLALVSSDHKFMGTMIRKLELILDVNLIKWPSEKVTLLLESKDLNFDLCRTLGTIVCPIVESNTTK